jgi:glycosyltransferase involved in cell wall biosynthesis
LADAAIELMERTELREHLEEQGRRLAETLTLERMVDTYERALEEGLHQRTRAGAC